MQKVIQRFTNDIKKEVAKSKFRNKIVSIVLIGSAAKGEWIRGESDVDIIIVVEKDSYKNEVSDFFSKLLKKLNKKYRLKLEKTTSTAKYKNPFVNAVMKIETLVFFGVAFSVVSCDDYDFLKNKIKSPRVLFMATFVGSINTFLKSVKETGKTIYGKNLLRGLDIRLSFFDRVSINLQQIYIIFASILLLPFDPKLSIKHAMKSSLYQEEFDLMFLRKKTKGYFHDENLFDKTFIGSGFMKTHLRTTLQYRKNYNRLKVSPKQAFDYLVSTIKFIFQSNKKLDELMY